MPRFPQPRCPPARAFAVDARHPLAGRLRLQAPYASLSPSTSRSNKNVGLSETERRCGKQNVPPRPDPPNGRETN